MSLLAVCALSFVAGLVGAAIRDLYLWWLHHGSAPMPPRLNFPYDHEKDGI